MKSGSVLFGQTKDVSRVTKLTISTNFIDVKTIDQDDKQSRVRMSNRGQN